MSREKPHTLSFFFWRKGPVLVIVCALIVAAADALNFGSKYFSTVTFWGEEGIVALFAVTFAFFSALLASEKARKDQGNSN